MRGPLYRFEQTEGVSREFKTNASLGRCSEAEHAYFAKQLRIPVSNLTSAAALHNDLFVSAHAANYPDALDLLPAEDGVRSGGLLRRDLHRCP